jgi:hypothetical protein
VSKAPTRRRFREFGSTSINLGELRGPLDAIAARRHSTLGQVVREACALAIQRDRRGQRRWDQPSTADAS